MKTAIQWLVEQLELNNYISENAHWLIHDAKELEKQQIIDAKDCWLEDERDGEQYYEQNFKK